MNVLASTKLYKNYQIAIPKIIRDRLDDLKMEDTVIDWIVNNDGEIIIKPRKKYTVDDLDGIIDLGYNTDAVELKKELYE